MPRHSKNNTALAFFTSAERAMTSYGTQKQRLGRDSMRDFDACQLCLSQAILPVCCSEGHLYCKECIVGSILQQKKQIQKNMQDAAAYDTASKALDTARAKEQTNAQIEAFKKLETNPLAKGTVSEAGSNKPALPSFWIPSLTPDAAPSAPRIEKEEPLCIAAEKPHPISLKKLVNVKFASAPSQINEEGGDVKSGSKHCPSCLTNLRNGSKIVVLKGCGHAICKSCCARFVKPQKKCSVCDATCKDKDVIDLDIEGTGFSGGGKAEASKSGPAFQ